MCDNTKLQSFLKLNKVADICHKTAQERRVIPVRQCQKIEGYKKATQPYRQEKLFFFLPVLMNIFQRLMCFGVVILKPQP